VGRPLNSLNRKGRNDRKGKVSDLKRKTIFGADRLTKKEAQEFERLTGMKYTKYKKDNGFKQALMQSKKLGITSDNFKNTGKGKVLGKDVNKKSDNSRKRKY
jgi:hypothetical protein